MPVPSAESRLTHVLRHLDAYCTVPDTARPGYDALAPVRLSPPTAAAEAFFHGTAPLPPPQDEVQWLHLLGAKVPVLFEGDIVSTIFFWLSGWQEVYSLERDRFGRFPYAASLQARLGCIALPVADMLLETLRLWLEDSSGVSLVRHPSRPPLAVSHDVDHLQGGWKAMARYHWRAKRRVAAVRAISNHLTLGPDPFDNLPAVAEIVRQETNTSSTFYFLGARGKHPLGPNADYDVTSAGVQQRIRELERLGCSVGLHASFGTSTNPEQLREELEKLPHLITGVRFHYLCFDPVETPRILAQVGATHDATLGFAERAGFRHGTAHPFWLYDFARQRAHRTIYYPLHAMDVTFANVAYQFTPAPDIPYRIAELARAAQLCGGTFHLLWHNEYLVPSEELLGEDTFRKSLRQAMNSQ